MARKLVLFASLFFVALASGGAFVVSLAYNPATMAPAFYVQSMQHAIRVMLPLAVAMNLGLVFTAVSAMLARRDRGSLYLLGAASTFIVGAVLVTVFGNWPINEQIIKWDVASPPSNWMDLRDAWWRYHLARFGMGLAALTAAILAGLRSADTAKQGGP